MNDALESISFFSEKYDTLLAMVTAREEVIKLLQSEVASLQSAVSDQAVTIKRQKSDINESEQYSRLSNLEIHEHPCRDDENLISFLTGIAGKLDVALQPSEVLAIHRLPSKRAAAPPILVRFASVGAKERFVNYRKKLNSLSRTTSTPKLYFNDNLFRANRELFWLARLRGKEKSYQFVWVRNAKIFAKKGEDAPIVRITHFKDLKELCRYG